jgi:hypothetical protein
MVVLVAVPLQVQAGPEDVLGRWALNLPHGAGWLEVLQQPGYLDANILWYGGSVVPVSNVYLDGETLLVEQGMAAEHPPVQAEGPPRVLNRIRRIRLQPQGEEGDLRCTASTPRFDGRGVEQVSFTATRIPPLPAAPDLSGLRWGEPVPLFNGTDLTGWQVVSPGAGNGWTARAGVLANNPAAIGKEHTSNLRTVETFEDFRLTLDVNVPAGSNSGVYLRGIYEVQISDSYGRDVNPHHMGAIYSRITPAVAAEKPAGEWQTLDITLCRRHVTVVLNGQTLIDNQPLYGVTGGAMWADESRPGPILLQGDHGAVSYRNMMLHPILD